MQQAVFARNKLQFPKHKFQKTILGAENNLAKFRAYVYNVCTMNRKFILVLALVVLLFSASAWAGFTSRETGTTEDINAIFFPLDALGFGACNNGIIIRTINAGLTWEVQTIGTTQFNDVFFVSSAEGYVIGENGVIQYTTDWGTNYSQITFAGIPAAMSLRRGSVWGTTWSIAGYDSATTTSYIITSTESTGMTASTFPGFQVGGVHLASSETGSGMNTWVWGQDSGGNGVIFKNGSTSETVAGVTVTDVFFITSEIGYASMSNGTVYKTINAGSSWTAQDTQSGTPAQLNAVFFITDLFGWAVGDSGTIAFTADGGTAWVSYNLGDPSSPDINDIYARLVSSSSSSSGIVKAASVKIAQTTVAVYAFIAGTGGQLYQLQSPTITSVSPTPKLQGWIGTIEVTGTGFIDGVQITLTPEAGVTVLYTSFESDTRIWAPIVIDTAEAVVGAYDVWVTNPDATTTSEANAFKVTAYQASVTFDNIWLDGNLYYPPHYDAISGTVEVNTINLNPGVSFDAISTLNGMSVASANIQVLFHWVDSGVDQYVLSQITPEVMTQMDANTVRVACIIPEALSPEVYVDMTLYAEDNTGIPGRRTLLVLTATSEVPSTPPPEGGGGLPGIFVPSKNTFDPQTEASLPAIIQLQPGLSVPDIRIIVTNFTGQKIYDQLYSKSAGTLNAWQVPTERGFVTKINVEILTSRLMPHLPSGAYVIIVYNPINNQLIAKSSIIIAPKAIRP